MLLKMQPIFWHRAQGVYISQGGNSRVMPHGDVSLGRPWYRGFWDKKRLEREKQLTIHDRSKRLLGTLGLQMLGGGEEEKERSLCSRDVIGAKQRRE